MKIFTVFVVLVSLPSLLFASDIYVDVDFPAGSASNGSQLYPFREIQPAVNIASDGDTILIAPGIYTGPQNRDITVTGLNITIRSTDPYEPAIVESTIIDCGFDATGDHRAFVIRSGETSVSIEGLTIQNGNASSLEGLGLPLGGAIAVADGADATISKCNFIANAAMFGGAIGCFDASVRISDCDMIANSTYSGGSGGAVYVLAGDLQVMRCRMNGNFSDWQGGAVATNLSLVRIEYSEIQNNTARIDGGALEFLEDDAMVSKCLITNNAALTNGNGGGINCSWAASSLRITNCTIAGNSAEYGGGIALLASDAIVSNTILVENAAANGSQAALRIDNAASNLIVSYSDVQFGEVGVFAAGGSVNYDSSNIDAGAMFAFYDRQADPSMWDFHLMSTSGRYENGVWVKDAQSSPCLDAADLQTAIDDEPWPNGGRVNMGAYGNSEQASKSGNVADLNIDGAVDEIDLNYIVQSWLSQAENYEDLNNDGIVNLDDLAVIAQNWF